jgi:hypothetical protein
MSQAEPGCTSGERYARAGWRARSARRTQASRARRAPRARACACLLPCATCYANDAHVVSPFYLRARARNQKNDSLNKWGRRESCCSAFRPPLLPAPRARAFKLARRPPRHDTYWSRRLSSRARGGWVGPGGQTRRARVGRANAALAAPAGGALLAPPPPRKTLDGGDGAAGARAARRARARAHAYCNAPPPMRTTRTWSCRFTIARAARSKS